jgi:hypothetical protein
MKLRRTALAAPILALALAGWPDGSAATGGTGVPVRLSDQEFWRLSEAFSEPGGTFHSDNVVSNEAWYQHVVPDLVQRARSGGVYLGVGPEQNFTYMVALRPRMAFIIDIRRGNLHEHLLYKALFEMSTDRADFVSRLFSRVKPAGLTVASPVEQIFDAVQATTPSRETFERNVKSVADWLTVRHGFALRPEDLPGIEYVYTQFFAAGPGLVYTLNTSSGGRAIGSPSYAALMAADDGQGVQRGFLVTDERFQWLKGLHQRNMLVPVVGNFGGPRAIRQVGQYLKSVGATVSAFYLSNVEMYLQQDRLWDAFCRNVAALPLEASSTFIRSFRGGGRSTLTGPGGFATSLGVMTTEVSGCAPPVPIQ